MQTNLATVGCKFHRVAFLVKFQASGRKVTYVSNRDISHLNTYSSF